MNDPITPTSFLIQNYRRQDVSFVRGAGCYLYDGAGREYLDAFAGVAVCTLGHSHPKLVETLSRQAATLIHTSNHYEQIGQEELAARGLDPLPPDVLVYNVEGPFFFGAVENFERALAFTHTDPRVLILRLRWVPFMDITGVQALEAAIEDLKRRGVRVMITGANARVAAKLDKAGVLGLIGRENFCDNIVEALQALGHRAAD